MKVPIRINELLDYNLDNNMYEISLTLFGLFIGFMIILFILGKWTK